MVKDAPAQEKNKQEAASKAAEPKATAVATRPKRRVGGRRERKGAGVRSGKAGAGAQEGGGGRSGKRVQYKKRCLFCRKTGHTLAECREARGESVGICYNCGSPDHCLRDCPEPRTGDALRFARCFVCGETGHLASRCPKNSHGMYPEGGACRVCGSVYHKMQDCPLKNKKRAGVLVGVDAAASGDADVDEGDQDTVPSTAAADTEANDMTTKKRRTAPRGKVVSF